MQLLPTLMAVTCENQSAIKLSRQFTSTRTAHGCNHTVESLGKPCRVTLNAEECEAVNTCLGDEVLTTGMKVERCARAVINGALYHSTIYKRVSKMNNYTIMYQDDETEQEAYASIHSFVRVNGRLMAIHFR